MQDIDDKLRAPPWPPTTHKLTLFAFLSCRSFGESLCSLRFASAVNKCELGKPKKSIEDDEGEPKAKSNEATTRGRNGSTTAARASSTVRSGGAGRTPSKNGGTRSRSSPSKIRTNLEKKSSRLAGR
jgi:hypothetical protein